MHFDGGPAPIPQGLHSLALAPYDMANIRRRHQAPELRGHWLHWRPRLQAGTMLSAREDEHYFHLRSQATAQAWWERADL